MRPPDDAGDSNHYDKRGRPHDSRERKLSPYLRWRQPSPDRGKPTLLAVVAVATTLVNWIIWTSLRVDFGVLSRGCGVTDSKSNSIDLLAQNPTSARPSATINILSSISNWMDNDFQPTGNSSVLDSAITRSSPESNSTETKLPPNVELRSSNMSQLIDARHTSDKQDPLGSSQGALQNGSPTTKADSAESEIPRRQATVPIFYNIFIPDDTLAGGANTHRAHRIVAEQLRQVAQSYAGGYYDPADHTRHATNASVLPSVHLYYTTIGPKNWLTERRMRIATSFCGKLPHFVCKQLAHLTNGSESYTLDQMRQYCVAHPNDRVIYLHTKGSYHPNTLNDAWRRALTLGATARECIEPPDDRCNVCGVLFYTQFTTFVPGNMFTAKCEYVSRLLSPLSDFPAKHEEAISEALLLRARRQLTSRLLEDRPDLYGLDRYNAEHWIGKPTVCSMGG
jgi:hypothetical protein